MNRQKANISRDTFSAKLNTEFGNLGTLDMGPYRPGEEEAILDCLAESFRCKKDLEKWRHLYLHNPGGEAIILVARHQDRIISHKASLPRRITAFHGEGVAAHIIDSATRSDWQRKGISTKLAMKAKQMASDRGFLVTYSFLNELSSHGAFKYEGRTAVRSLPVLVRPLASILTSLAFARSLLGEIHSRRKATQKKLTISEAAVGGPLPLNGVSTLYSLSSDTDWTLPFFDHRHTQLFKEAESIPPIALIRDAAQLSWRYASSSGSPYLHQDIVEGSAIVATAVVRFAKLFGLSLVVVMEWFWRQGERRKGLLLLQKVLKLARTVKAHGVTALAMPGTAQRRLLYHQGFIAIPNALLPRTTILGACPHSNDVDKTRWYKPRNWYLTYGDGFLL